MLFFVCLSIKIIPMKWYVSFPSFFGIVGIKIVNNLKQIIHIINLNVYQYITLIFSVGISKGVNFVQFKINDEATFSTDFIFLLILSNDLIQFEIEKLGLIFKNNLGVTFLIQIFAWFSLITLTNLPLIRRTVGRRSMFTLIPRARPYFTDVTVSVFGQPDKPVDPWRNAFVGFQ